ncbi:GAF and ANTAR domain-containing protein [Rathayibacter sp. VKM Ac-2801]|uniref:GAF and ANTAR domain-containing protein n=1 Tax=Rathayibacter sp. VKM Ac-2801 TaxID=2609255 RepID=UPI00131FF6EA|nr:GAF and ANTAR domain-containing protein [Rathayibacter sp. VKM Ac-2801]QHC69289.1 ANTAR domain-containing protein [Rathayibacter sp. VKM Ac-2801]
MTGSDDLTTLTSSLCTLLPYEDAAASSLEAPFDVETLAASSERAAALDEAQLDLGEGPGWEAFHAGRSIRTDVDAESGASAWPVYRSAPAVSGVRSVLALPLSFGPLRIGAVTLFSTGTTPADTEHLQLAEGVVTLLARAVVTRALSEAQSGVVLRDAALSRREVHQATGMVISQAGTGPADALLLLRAYAFSTSTTVRQVASDIIARRLDLSPLRDLDH